MRPNSPTNRAVSRSMHRSARNTIFRILPQVWIDMSQENQDELAKVLGVAVFRTVPSHLDSIRGAVGELLDRYLMSTN